MRVRTVFFLLIISGFMGSCVRNDDTPLVKAYFSEDYISEHKGRYVIEVPKVYELAHVVMAVKFQRQRSDYFIEKRTSYFQEVLDYFNDYNSSRIFSNYSYSESDYIENYAFRDNSYAYKMVNEEISLKETYTSISQYDIFKDFLDDVQAFSYESNFNDFYTAHAGFYENQIALYDAIIPVQDMWDWLENQFSARYDCYKIIISPLTGGSHSTRRFKTDTYKETLMFVPALNPEIHSMDTLNIAYNIRHVFTEIDHNYVNPVTEEFRDELKKAMGDLNNWKDEKPSNTVYSSHYMVFNEYMTWAVYDIYISERYPEHIASQIREITISKMEGDRGFIRFRSFEDSLIQIYTNKSPGENIEDLYPEILKAI
ncbi:DUF4932 domain-containing protein [Gracilimonas mengyeensis]|uniref:DUF4932 domain-containing protein n=1 Tax=Gracilimonas mengyeensis TaxID=1302730 RepID=A0A521EK66_9BACT|nr:DUF4932 domain-containing protein [Gracilimonas mengyeensis]SMO84305.1 protein of unknown function [Gracilimonas mengyeensis]